MTLRIAQWATGNIGTRALRAVLDHPGMDLVAVYVHDDGKVGLDAGDLCGRDTTGVVATDDMSNVLTAKPDCVLYMPRSLDPGEVITLLSSGIDVVTTRGEFHHPASMDPRLRDEVTEACLTGSSSIHSTGSCPGFATEALPRVLASVQRSLTTLRIDEFADLSKRDSPGLLFDVMGFGRTPGAMDPRRLRHARDNFGPSLRVVADALGLPLDSVDADGEYATAVSDVTIAAGVIPAGTVAGQRFGATGYRRGRPLLEFRATWYCTTELDADWHLGNTGWRVDVTGDAPLTVDVAMPVALEDMASVSPGYTAHRAVNAVPYVCAASPGIRMSTDLPAIVPTLLDTT